MQSYSLKKALSKQVTKEYMKSGIFTEFQRGLPETVVKKSKSFNQKNYIREPKQIDNDIDESGYRMDGGEINFF